MNEARPDLGVLDRRTSFTLGHSTRTRAEFVELLRQVDGTLVADVRSFPRTRAMRLFKADAVPESLAEDGIGDRHLRALGGKSDHRKGTPPWFNHCWRVLAFRNYSEYAETDEFHAGLFALCEFAHGHQDVIMCAEAVWWRCHRRFIIDYLLVGCTHVDHIMRLVGGFGDSVIFTTVTDDARTCRRDPKSARHPAGRLHRKLALRSGLLREPHVEGCNTLRLREPEAAMAGVTVEVSC